MISCCLCVYATSMANGDEIVSIDAPCRSSWGSAGVVTFYICTHLLLLDPCAGAEVDDEDLLFDIEVFFSCFVFLLYCFFSCWSQRCLSSCYQATSNHPSLRRGVLAVAYGGWGAHCSAWTRAGTACCCLAWYNIGIYNNHSEPFISPEITMGKLHI